MGSRLAQETGDLVFSAAEKALKFGTEDGRRDQFGYDFSGELTSAQYGLVGGANPQRTVSYNLDAAGNRSSVVDGGQTKNYVTNNLNQYTTGDSSAVTNATSHAIETFQGLTYSYLNDRQLSSVIGNGNNYSIRYDALGRTVKRTLNSSSTYFFYDGANPILERGAVTASNIFGPGTDEILIRFMVGDIHYFYQDQLGSVTHVANNSGQMVETYRYDAFGAPTIRDGAGNPRSASAINNRFMFTGREWAPGSLGFYEYRARAYHPSLGRFMQPDPIDFGGKDTNLLRYTGNDPINRRDPTGLAAVDTSSIVKWLSEMLSTGGAETTTPRVTVTGTVPQAPQSGDSIGLSPGIGGDAVGGAGDSGGGNDGGSGGGSRWELNIFRWKKSTEPTPTPPPPPQVPQLYAPEKELPSTLPNIPPFNIPDLQSLPTDPFFFDKFYKGFGTYGPGENPFENPFRILVG
jgi:RHS repeat-associated protein